MLNIYKASAGAGKTYTLTLEYIKLLFKDAKNYRKTLAVTFTNNACGEMKNRILQALYELSYKDDANYITELEAEKYTKEQIKEKAKFLYKDILHNYSFFFIETIDAFTQKVIRNFAKDLGLPPKFSLELRQDEVLETVVKNLLINSIDDKDLHQILVDFAFDDIEENRSTDLKKEIKNESNKFFKELYQEYADIQSYKEDEKVDTEKLQNFFKDLETSISDFHNEVYEKAQKAVSLIEKAGLDITSDFKGKSRSPLITLKHYTNKNFDKILNDEVCDVESVIKEKKTEAQIRGLYNTEFQEIINNLTKLIGVNSEKRKEIKTAEIILSHKKGIILSQFIQKELDKFCKDENTFFIAFANKFLKTIINGSDTPFVYEKIGQQIENIMIDEFQDTSKMQWDNFKPIVSNLLSAENDALIIGDVKQSIYRFRNGDWKLLHTLNQDKDFAAYTTEKSIANNHRSLRNIVEFNNRFFKAYSQYVDENHKERHTITDIYNDCEQGVAKGDGGCVEIKIINANGEKDTAAAQEELLNAILEKVVSLLKLGRKPEEIVFLCYTGKEISELVNFFNEKKKNPEYADFKDSFSIINKEALLLKNSLAIQFIVNYLQKLITNENSQEANFLDEFLSFAYSTIHNTKELPNVEISRNMSLFETCEDIIDKFNLASEAETPYLTDFQNIVYTYSKNNNTSISHFLEHWEEIKDKTYLQQTTTSGCMSAYTVHKSKGLEYPVVIMPKFCKRPFTTTTALYPTDYKDLPIVSLSGKLEGTTLEDAYFEEKYNDEIDRINALYVACTRPKEELYIFDKRTSKDKSAVSLFDKIIAEMTEGEISDYTFKIGEPRASKASVGKQNNFIKRYPITVVPEGEESNVKLLPDRNSKHFIEMLEQPQTEREHGLLMHKILEHINTSADIDKYVNQYCPPELFSMEEKKELAEKLRSKITNPQVAHWFDDSWDTILTEQPVLQKGGIEKRPDRMLLKGKEVTIIDYKFGKEQSENYNKQVKEYMNILTEMRYSAKGFIWYVELDEIVAI